MTAQEKIQKMELELQNIFGYVPHPDGDYIKKFLPMKFKS